MAGYLEGPKYLLAQDACWHGSAGVVQLPLYHPPPPHPPPLRPRKKEPMITH